jgi:hypothetical protein
MISGYEERGVINADECGLLWVMTDKTQPMKGDKYKV